jgi:hypothetical protein
VRARGFSTHFPQFAFFKYNRQKEYPNSRNDNIRMIGLNGDRKAIFPKKPIEVPKIINIAGPIQQDVANSAESITLKLAASSFFIMA